ncbi:MAG: fumarylacetoacetate hydrolase family protein [Hyphomonadaceae bacterium]|nr:fumarylacetoacetate hydrolase family protein [Hyphomonadaceae bacterium]
MASTDFSAIAAAFVDARLHAGPLGAFPGKPPRTLAEAYAIQDAAIPLWPGDVAGWKIGLVQPAQRATFGEARIAGPIFRENLRFVESDVIAAAPVFEGGFAAVEAEFAVLLKADAPPARTEWAEEDAAALVGAAHIAIEIASSPLASINDLGPAVTVADFGNNFGLVIGPRIPDWGKRAWRDLSARMSINEQTVGEGSAASLPGGPLAALAFILSNCAKRGRPLKAGDWISTGATTGVHLINLGETARADFGALGSVCVRAERASPRLTSARSAVVG